MGIQEIHYANSNEQREKIEAVLVRLRAMRSKVNELRMQCESLKSVRVHYQSAMIVCSDCGKQIELDQEIIVKDDSGNPMSYYHKGCFEQIWAAQTWRFDYSVRGFLRKIEKGKASDDC